MLQEVHVDGLKQLRNALKEIGPDSVKEMRLALRAGAEQVAGRARELAPYSDRPKPEGVPHLRDTLKAGASGPNARIYSPSVYGNPIHWGWPSRGIKAHPFIEQAIQEKQEEFVATLEEGLDALYLRHGL